MLLTTSSSYFHSNLSRKSKKSAKKNKTPNQYKVFVWELKIAWDPGNVCRARFKTSQR